MTEFQSKMIRGGIWVIGITLMVFLVIKEKEPVYMQESLTAAESGLSDPLYPGDVLEQSFRPSADHLYTIEIGLDYSEDAPDEDTMVLVQIIQNETVLQEQELAVWVFGRLGFLSFLVDQAVDRNQDVTILVKNVSEADGNCFSVMTTDKEYLYLDNTKNYLLNGKEQEGRMISRYTYLTGYRYYAAISKAFIVFLAVLLIREIFSNVNGKWRCCKDH